MRDRADAPVVTAWSYRAARGAAWPRGLQPPRPSRPILLLLAGPRLRFGGFNRGGREQPGVDVVRDGLQPRIVDTLAVVGGHVGGLMPHDKIARGLVLGAVGHGAENVAKGVEPQPLSARDAE